jgi:hypothetical protein
MLQVNINNIRSYIEDFKTINLEEILSLIYPDVPDLGAVQINRFSVLEFITYTRQFFEQLEQEIINNNALILPFIFTTPEFGQADIQTQINSFITSIKNSQISTAENQLAWLLLYQLQNGFYNKSQYKFQSVNATEIKKTHDAIGLQIVDIQKLNKQFKEALDAMKLATNNLSDFKTQKENELLQIANNLATTNTNNNSIQDLLTLSTQSNTKINLLLADAEKDKQKSQELSIEMEKSVSKSKGEFADFLSLLKTTEEKYQDLYQDFEEKLKFVESKHEYFTDRNTYLDTLIGREVGASLFETFKQRKTELSSPLKFWRWAIGIMTGITFLGIFAIFTNLFGYIPNSNRNQLSWELIVVNAIKSSPFIFLLYYTIAQYNKERNFQEEYAFKSAVALTINAYADVLKDEKAKDELILKAVYGIYRSPIYSKIKANKEVNSVLDLLKEAIDKGTGLISKK